MSSCKCSGHPSLRVSGEVWDNSHNDSDVVGAGPKSVRVRCGRCGGKVARIGSDLLTEVFGYDEDEIENGRCLDPNNQQTLRVDLL